MNRPLSEFENVIAILFADDGIIPNSKLPLLVYREAIGRAHASPESIEALLEKTNWPPQWRSTIFTYHHFHSTAHEVLGVASGWARVMMGGPKGEEFTIAPGDVILIPAGVGHKRLESSSDFLVCGGYPPGQDWDLRLGEPGERPMVDKNLARVPLPETDPVFGSSGPVHEIWQKIASAKL